jgi:CheY-like chemotaxis protein
VLLFTRSRIAVPSDPSKAGGDGTTPAQIHRYPMGTMRMGHRPMRSRWAKLASMTDVAAPRAYVLEDDADIAALEADLLREMGFSVVTCTRIVELGDLMDLALPHLLVVDVMLPDGDGGDITELLRTAWPGIPAVFVSAANRERLAALEPIGPVVAKPFDLDAFREAVMMALDGARELRTAS